MYNVLSTIDGKRKYCTLEEQERFLLASSQHERPEVRTFCDTLAFTGCRISEALELTPERIDVSAKAIIFRTLKQGKDKKTQKPKIRFRSVPIPDTHLEALLMVHEIRKRQKSKSVATKTAKLWDFKRAMASRHVDAVMTAAGIEGAHACPKGLRHGFGIRMAGKTRNPALVKKLMGHVSMENTAIYMDLVGEEAHAEVIGAW